MVVGEYADTLRALGRYLDQLGASNVVIIEEPTHLGADPGPELGVVWNTPDRTQEARLFGGAQLRALRITARLFRGLEHTRPTETPNGASGGTLGAQLRTIGSVVDEAQACGVIITEMAGGFRLSAVAADRELAETYARHEVAAMTQQRFGQRSAQPPA
jgi:hypothetical protein